MRLCCVACAALARQRLQGVAPACNNACGHQLADSPLLPSVMYWTCLGRALVGGAAECIAELTSLWTNHGLASQWPLGWVGGGHPFIIVFAAAIPFLCIAHCIVVAIGTVATTTAAATILARTVTTSSRSCSRSCHCSRWPPTHEFLAEAGWLLDSSLARRQHAPRAVETQG